MHIPKEIRVGRYLVAKGYRIGTGLVLRTRASQLGDQTFDLIGPDPSWFDRVVYGKTAPVYGTLYLKWRGKKPIIPPESWVLAVYGGENAPQMEALAKALKEEFYTDTDVILGSEEVKHVKKVRVL